MTHVNGEYYCILASCNTVTVSGGGWETLRVLSLTYVLRDTMVKDKLISWYDTVKKLSCYIDVFNECYLNL